MLPIPQTRNGRLGNVPTSWGEGTTPEQALAVAVILTAIQDLQSNDEQDRWEAHEFFLQPKGPWAEMRRFYFQAVNLDDVWLQQYLSARLNPPERPYRKWTYMSLLDVLPTDRTFTAADVCELTDLNLPQVNSKMQSLKNHGHVVRLDHGVYCVPAFEARWRQKEAEAIETQNRPTHTPFVGFDVPARSPTGPTQKVVLDALRAGRETIREIGWDVEMDFNSLKCALDRLIARGLVEKDGPRYRLVPETSVVAANG